MRRLIAYSPLWLAKKANLRAFFGVTFSIASVVLNDKDLTDDLAKNKPW